MSKFVLIFVSILLFVGCAPTQEIEPTPDIDAIVSATVSAQQVDFFTPELLAPANGAGFANPASVVLEWDWVRDLGENEFFDVRVWRDGEPDFGITWSDNTTFNLAEWLSQQESGEFLWSVAVIEGDLESRDVVDLIGEAPEPRRFSVDSTTLPTPTPEPTPPPFTIDNIITGVVEGFTIEIVGRIEDAPTAITEIEFTSDGDLLALALDGRLFDVTDDDNDGFYDSYEQIMSQDLSFEWAVGMALYDDRLYISDEGRIGYIEDTDGDGIYETYTNIFDEFSGRVYPLHSNNDILIYDDLLYVAVGSTSDHGPINEEYESAIFTMELDGSNITQFATGLRNPYALTMSADGRLFTGDNSPDGLSASLPFYPPEELNYIQEGRHYGFPDVYGNGYAIRDVDYETQDPITQLITSTATTGVAYYGEDHFPEYYQDGVFVAQFGGIQRGLAVVFVPLEETEDGNYRGQWESFVTFREGSEPVGLKVAPDGSLYITEWSRGHILRVTYTGNE